MKVLHVLANSPPDVNGYAIRTQKILENHPNQVVGLTSPWYPDRDSMVEEYDLDGIKILRTIHPVRKTNTKFSHNLVKLFTPDPEKENKRKRKKRLEKDSKKILPLRIFDFFYYAPIKLARAIRHFFRLGWKVVEEKILIKYFTKRIIEVAKQENVDLIHAHTPYRVGLPALKAARKLKLPFVYEMRGMWEETAVANGRWKKNGPAYRRFQKFETKVLKKADAVVCISETLKTEAISRGVKEAKITVVTNAVEYDIAENNTKGETYKKTVKDLNKGKSTKVVGYIGSLREMEGVDLTAEAVSQLISQGHDVKFLALTSESGQAELQQYCDQLGLGDNAVITGPVPHKQVGPFYDLIDIFVVSRPDTAVTRIVTPLKPFEAMAMGKAVIASRLPALAEIIDDEKTGLLYQPELVSSLCNAISICLNDDNYMERLCANAKDWVINNRTWDHVVKNYPIAYQIAIDSRG